MQIEQKLLNEINARLERQDANGGNGWASTRRLAAGAFKDMGLPTRRSEAYKYTPVAKRFTDNLSLENEAGTVQATRALEQLDGIHLSTTNGLLDSVP
ncbi:MAG: hypothetical protein ACPG8N_09375, partial [Rhodothermales bacterium]